MNRAIVHPAAESWINGEGSGSHPNLLSLVPVRGMSDEFGYLFRHYWLPATTLHYRETVELTGKDGKRSATQTEYRVQMKKCDADACVWRQAIVSTDDWDDMVFRLTPIQMDEILCRYDRTEQMFWTKSILAFEVSQRDDREARLEALLRQPLMAPLLPIPVGFRWHVSTDDGTMEFFLESVDRIGETDVARIRRQGTFVVDRIYLNGVVKQGRYTVQREGVTYVATKRSAILEDRTRDRLTDPNRPGGWPEIRTQRTLIKSVQESVVSLAPLVEKYRVDGIGHLYDCATGQVIQVDETAFEIIDDIGILTNNEIRAKYVHLDPEKLDVVFKDLNLIQKNGMLPGHGPQELSRIERVYQNRHERDLGEFWQTTAMMLILGVTEQCNLNCGYCCYSGKFAGQRTHGRKSMPLEIARKAITDYLAGDHAGTSCPISFYGGEPLLESYHLFRECVRLAISTAEPLGKTVRFAVTTNGTLLDDETVDFLVEHEFLVMVSLDGPKEIHDRYRVFGDGSGSFDVIETNLARFCERYPNYPHRGLNLTLAPPFDLDATARLVDDYFPFFPLSRANLVNTGTEYRFTEHKPLPLQYGCPSSTCQTHSCHPDPFRQFGPDEQKQLKKYWDMAVSGLAGEGGMKSWEKIPFAMMLFEQQLALYHRRPVTERSPEWLFSIPCIPGFTRRFVDVDGNYRTCERVDNSESYILGNVSNGPDVSKLYRTMEQRRHFGDCGNCTALKVCDLCYARIPDSDGAKSGYDPLFERQCRETRRTLPEMMATYTKIMDANPTAFDTPSEEGMIRYQQIKYGSPGSRLAPETLKQLKLEVF